MHISMLIVIGLCGNVLRLGLHLVLSQARLDRVRIERDVNVPHTSLHGGGFILSKWVGKPCVSCGRMYPVASCEPVDGFKNTYIYMFAVFAVVFLPLSLSLSQSHTINKQPRLN
jgi:hypothetical protein